MSPKSTANFLETKPSTLLTEDINPVSYGSPNGKSYDRFSRTDTDAMNNIVKNHPINK
jgi:hypothetical protein